MKTSDTKKNFLSFNIDSKKQIILASIEKNLTSTAAESLGAKFDVVDIPADLKDKENKYRKELVEAAVEEDEKLMEAYLEGKEPSESELIKCIRKGTLGFNFVPITTGSAFKNLSLIHI